jgi:hypothetical protein
MACPFRLVLNNSRCELVRRGSVYAPECGRERATQRRPLLVTGVGRSGTEYLHELLTRAGLNMSHEHWPVGSGGAIAWPFLFTNQRCAYPQWASHGRLRQARRDELPAVAPALLFDRVMHLIRSPLKTIASRHNRGRIDAFRYLSRCNTRVVGANFTDRSPRATLDETLQHWVLWNSFAEAVADGWVSIERVSSATLLPLLHRAGLAAATSAERIDLAAKHLSATKNSAHTRKSDNVTWAALAAIRYDFALMAQMIALRHGYVIDGDERLPPLRTAATMDESGACPEQHCGFEPEGGKWACRFESQSSSPTSTWSPTVQQVKRTHRMYHNQSV